ncbi:MAG: ABC transporter ATP-binding protein [Leeuwenhoekiella sp.]|nr:ABC transporter ATP-binding protein [Leeuwenhoekiella sp.]
MALLQVNNISKSFGKKQILESVDFQLATGEILGVFGRNGSGKSTLLTILFGTQTAKTGTIKINETQYSVRKHFWNKNPIVAHELIGYLPQFSFLSQSSKVWDLIPRYFEGAAQDLIFRAPRMSKIANRKVNELSLGERRYLEVLIVGNLKHPFLLLDEPFSMVEPLFKELIHEFLSSLKSKKGILLTDHYYQDVWQLADRNLVLKDGKLKTVNALEDLVNAGYLRSM